MQSNEHQGMSRLHCTGRLLAQARECRWERGATREGKEWIWTCTQQPRLGEEQPTRQQDNENETRKQGAQKRGEERSEERRWGGSKRDSPRRVRGRCS